MNYKVATIPPFEKQLKRLAKKYPSLKTEYSELIESLEEKPKQGKAIGKNCYKIRLAIKSKGSGKRGGGRVITYVQVLESMVYLLAIYDKSPHDDVTDKEIRYLLSFIDE